MKAEENKIPLAIQEFILLKKAIDKYGEADQLNLLQEECGEVIVAINHYRRNRVSWEDVLEEMADVRILIDEFAVIGDNSKLLNEIRERKMARLEERLK
jgi:NTP pyrophosphatase (non-canonical NTP hydrolase)